MSRLSHPGIITLFETIETNRYYFIITELGMGGDLCSYVNSQKNGKLEGRVAQNMANQLVSAVRHLHDRDIIHRDLKMENILLDKKHENIKLVDFGLSNMLLPGKSLRTHCGSLNYAAPELYVSGKVYGPEIDIWSLGVVFYAMIIGRLPFQYSAFKGTHNEKRKQIMEDSKKGIGTIKHQRILITCSNLFRNLISKMLNPNPKERIKIKEVQMHIWIVEGGLKQITEFPTVDEEWKKEVIMEIAHRLDSNYLDVYSEIVNRPYGSAGGMYNIEKHNYLLKKISMKNFRNENLVRPGTKQIEKCINKPKTKIPTLRPFTTVIKNTDAKIIFREKQMRPYTTHARGDNISTSTNIKTKYSELEKTVEEIHQNFAKVKLLTHKLDEKLKKRQNSNQNNIENDYKRNQKEKNTSKTFKNAVLSKYLNYRKSKASISFFSSKKLNSEPRKNYNINIPYVRNIIKPNRDAKIPVKSKFPLNLKK